MITGYSNEVVLDSERYYLNMQSHRLGCGKTVSKKQNEGALFESSDSAQIYLLCSALRLQDECPVVPDTLDHVAAWHLASNPMYKRIRGSPGMGRSMGKLVKPCAPGTPRNRSKLPVWKNHDIPCPNGASVQSKCMRPSSVTDHSVCVCNHQTGIL